jgi:hypothetical protein
MNLRFILGPYEMGEENCPFICPKFHILMKTGSHKQVMSRF